MTIVIFVIIHWYLSLFSQSFLAHRYAAHGSFTMSKGWERFFYIFAGITQGSSYMSPRVYAIMHRMHHAYTDTPKDPHSPKYFTNVFGYMWHTRNVFSAIEHNAMPIEERFLKNLPDWPAFDKIATSWIARIIWCILYLLFYIKYATSPWLYLLLPLNILMGPIHGFIINWFAHKYGYVNFKVNNTSKNLLPFDFLMLGEAYHNNHHKFAGSINFGYRWFEIDPVYYIALLLNWLGIIHIKHTKRISSEF